MRLRIELRAGYSITGTSTPSRYCRITAEVCGLMFVIHLNEIFTDRFRRKHCVLFQDFFDAASSRDGRYWNLWWTLIRFSLAVTSLPKHEQTTSIPEMRSEMQRCALLSPVFGRLVPVRRYYERTPCARQSTVLPSIDPLSNSYVLERTEGVLVGGLGSITGKLLVCMVSDFLRLVLS